MATQIYASAEKAIPGLEQQIEKGEFTPLRQWLNTNIHQRGSLLPSADLLMTAATGAPLDSKFFIQHLTKKYSELYSC